MLAGNLKLQAEGPLKKKLFFLLKRPLICSHLSSHLSLHLTLWLQTLQDFDNQHRTSDTSSLEEERENARRDLQRRALEALEAARVC